MAGIKLKDYTQTGISLGETVTVICYDLTVGETYSINTEYADGTHGSNITFWARGTEREYETTPQKLGYFRIILYKDNVEIDRVLISVISSGSDDDELLSFEVYNINASLNSYDSSTGWASITISATFYNPNNERYSENVYIRAKAYYNDDTTFDASEQEDTYSISARGTKTFTHTYNYWYIGKNQFPVTIRVYAESEWGDLDYDDFEFTLAKDKPLPWYWISSSQPLKKGEMAVSEYITASKWLSLRDKIDETHEYNGTTRTKTISNVTSGVTTIKASHYVQMKDAINELKSDAVTVSNPIAGKTPISADIMMALQNGINNVINSLN